MSNGSSDVSAPAFELPAALEAGAPPEARGLARDEVRLMVAARAADRIDHLRFRDLRQVLAPGDLLVVNVSATLPAAVDARGADGSAVRVHFATPAPGLDDCWRVVELRRADGRGPVRGQVGQVLTLPAPAPAPAPARGSSWWRRTRPARV